MDEYDCHAPWEELYSTQPRPWRGSMDISWMPVAGHMTVLDVGCGNGKSTAALIELGCAVAAIDISETAIRSCEERFGGSALFDVADMRDIPYEDKVFDAVVAVHALEHIPAESEHLALEEFKRVLKPKGSLIMSLFAAGDFRAEGKRESIRNGILYRYHDEESIREALAPYWKYIDVETTEEKTRFGETRRRLHVWARDKRY